MAPFGLNNRGAEQTIATTWCSFIGTYLVTIVAESEASCASGLLYAAHSSLVREIVRLEAKLLHTSAAVIALVQERIAGHRGVMLLLLLLRLELVVIVSCIHKGI